MATARENALAFLKSKWYSEGQIADATANVQKQLDSWKSASSIMNDVKSNSNSYFGWSAMYGSSSGSSSSSSSSSSGSSSSTGSSWNSNTNATDPYWDVSWGNKWVWPMDLTKGNNITSTNAVFWENAKKRQAEDSSFLTNRNNDIAYSLYNNKITDSAWVEKFLTQFQDFRDASAEDKANTIRAISDRLSAIVKERDNESFKDVSDALNGNKWVDNSFIWKDWYYIDSNGKYQKIYWYDEMDDETKGLLDRMDDKQKKYVSNLWAQGMQDDIKYYLDTMRNKDQAAARQKNQQELYDINRESALIQAEQTLRNAEESYNNLKQNWQYLGNMWMPWTSATKIQAIWDAITEAKTQLWEVKRLTQLSLDAQEKQWQGQVLQYNQQIDNLMYDLKWKVWDEITWALSKYTTAELEGKLDTIDGITAFRKELLDDLDSNLSWLTSASLTQMQWINQQYQDIADKMYAYAQNANTVNTEMSQVKGFYVDGNGNPILNNMWQPIEIPPTAPMEPVFDKETGKLITFALDENWQIVANVQQLWNDTNSEAAQTQFWIVSMLQQWYSIWDILKMYPNASYKDVQALSEVVKQTMDKNGRSLTWEGGNYNAVDQATMENAYKNFTSKYATINKDGKFVLKKGADWQWLSWWQCWHFVNNYLQEMGIARLFTDPITDKIKNINSMEAKQGNVVIMDSPSSPQYWHVGIVTYVNPETWDMTIMQSNKQGEEKVFFSKKNVNDADVHWFFDPTKSIQDYNSQRQWEVTWNNDIWALWWYRDWYTSDYSNFLKNWTHWFTDWQRKELASLFWNWENFVANANAYKTEIDHQVSDVALTMVDNMVDILWFLNNWWTMNDIRLWVPIVNPKWWEMKKKYNQIMKSSALQKLIDLKEAWATFWALSDNELGFITDSADWFDIWDSQDTFEKALTSKIWKILGKSWMTLEQYYARRWETYNWNNQETISWWNNDLTTMSVIDSDDEWTA